MEIDQYAQVESVLILERGSAVRERAQLLLEADAVRVCATASPELFSELRESVPFDLLVVGLSDASDREALPDLETLELSDGEGGLALLAPLQDAALVRRLRVRFPAATLVDRALAEPDAFRPLLHSGLAAPRSSGSEPRDAVRETFEAFGLSERQLEVLRAALVGAPPAEIGQRLFISELTVRNHLHAIYDKVGVSGRRELCGRFVAALIGESSRA
jgi:DNA-binding CsgD family transcriptional regulator